MYIYIYTNIYMNMYAHIYSYILSLQSKIKSVKKQKLQLYAIYNCNYYQSILISMHLSISYLSIYYIYITRGACMHISNNICIYRKEIPARICMGSVANNLTKSKYQSSIRGLYLSPDLFSMASRSPTNSTFNHSFMSLTSVVCFRALAPSRRFLISISSIEKLAWNLCTPIYVYVGKH